MEKNCKVYSTYVQVLKDELVPAMGCTEPIAVAFCAAKAKDALGAMPDKVDIKVSGNIIKNVKSVVVPNTDGMVGMEAAAAAGIVFGKSEKDLEVIAEVTPQQKEELKEFLKTAEFTVAPTYGTEVLEIIITLEKDGHSSRARVIKSHAHLDSLEKDGRVIFKAEPDFAEVKAADKSLLNIKDIYEFAKTCDIEDIRPMIEYQIECNSAISAEGLTNDWGACNGKTLMALHGDDLRFRAAAAAAAGSDARMSGCELPVVIVSGSGNQGITASMPVVTYAREMGCSHEEMLRAVCFSDLVAIHEKTGIGALSAFCGAMCAGSGAAAGIAFLLGESEEDIEKILITSLGIVPSMICDGAKPSCGAKISAAVLSSLYAYDMLKYGRRLKGGDGYLSDDVEETIARIGRIGHDGMAETDNVVQAIMTE